MGCSAGPEPETSRETATAVSLSSKERSSGSFPLLAKNKNALLPGETHFLTCPFSPSSTVVVVGFRVADLPSGLRFSATTDLPFCTGGYCCRRSAGRIHRPADPPLPNFAACVMLMILTDGLANTGTAQCGYRQQRQTFGGTNWISCRQLLLMDRKRTSGARSRAELTRSRANE